MHLNELSKPLASGLLAFLLLVVITLVVSSQQAPTPRSAKAPVTTFSAVRAMPHVRQIAARPHPTWSPENGKVRQYILGQLKALGYQPTIHQAKLPGAKVLRRRAAALAGRTITNLMVRIKGSKSSGLVAVVSHYDSGRYAPGAADDGAAVAAMLETLRALKHLPQPKNDLLFLITDAEEIGLWGAKLFMKDHPWAREIKFVLNFEARGSRGPSLMFETTNNNGKTIAAFAKADHAPRATSLFFEVYRYLPNNTDFTIFKKRGIQGLNFAFIESIRDYHHPSDTPQRLSQASLQDHGQHMLSMLRHVSKVDLAHTNAPNLVYFDLLGRFLVHYSETTSLVLSLLLALVILLGLGYAFQQRLIVWWRVGLGLLFYLVSAGVVGFSVGWIAIQTLQWRGKRLYAFYWDIANDGLYIIAFLCLAGSLFFLCLGGMAKLLQRLERTFAILLLWAGLLLFVVFKAPGAGYLIMWPLAGATLACLLVIKQQQSVESLHFVSLRLWLCELPVLLLVVPLFYHLPYALTLSLTGVSAGLFVLFGALMFATQDTFVQAGYKWPVLGLFAGFVVFYRVAIA